MRRCPCLAFCRGPRGCGADRGATAWRTLTPAEWRSRSPHGSPHGSPRRARRVLASCWPRASRVGRCRRERSLRNQCANAALTLPLSLSLRMPPALLAPTAVRSGRTRAAGRQRSPQRLQSVCSFAPSCSDALMRPCCDLRVRVGSVVDAVYDLMANVYAGGASLGRR